MQKAKRQELTLKLGNLFIAIWAATIPTLITFGTFTLYGLGVCNSLEERVDATYKEIVKENCDLSAREFSRQSIIIIGFFITLPTWYWFYICMKRKRAEEA